MHHLPLLMFAPGRQEILIVLILLLVVFVSIVVAVVVIALARRSPRSTRQDGPAGNPAPPASYPDVETRLAELQRLLDRGTITQEEYQEQRRRIIEQV